MRFPIKIKRYDKALTRAIIHRLSGRGKVCSTPRSVLFVIAISLPFREQKRIHVVYDPAKRKFLFEVTNTKKTLQALYNIATRLAAMSRTNSAGA